MIDLTKNIISLTDEERHRFFLIVTENVDLFDKLIPNSPLFTLIKEGDIPYDHVLLQSYRDWRVNQ